MSKKINFDKIFQIIMERIIVTGQAPDYREIAAEMGVTPEEGQKAVRKLFSTTGFPGWFYPNSEIIMSFAPFNIASNNYRLTIDGEQKWFSQ
jgi:hypothetical protein